MRRARLAFLALAALCLAASASTHELSDLRRSHPEVDRAIAALPSSGINGTLNRLSSELARATPGDLTAAQEHRLKAGLAQLETDLRNGLPSLGIQDRLIIAQVVALIALDPTAQLFPELPGPTCPDGYGEWHGDCHAVTVLAADAIAELLDGSIREGFDAYAIDNPGVPVDPVPPAPADGPAAESFGSWIDDVVHGPGAIFGPESIDE